MEQAYRDGIVVQLKPGAVPQYKKYLDESKGRTITNDWWDIDQVAGDESIGYPTQKPLALLDRIIRASSNADDVVLDPFCGCATACVAAEKAERQWVGIDLSPKAKDLVELRLKKDLGMFGLETVYRTDIPRRTDVGELPHYRTHKHTLFGKQEGLCNGCGHFFPFRNFTVDHILSRHKGRHRPYRQFAVAMWSLQQPEREPNPIRTHSRFAKARNHRMRAANGIRASC